MGVKQLFYKIQFLPFLKRNPAVVQIGLLRKNTKNGCDRTIPIAPSFCAINQKASRYLLGSDGRKTFSNSLDFAAGIQMLILLYRQYQL